MGVHQDRRGSWFIQWRDKKTKKLKHKFFGKGVQAEAQARQEWEALDVRKWGEFRTKSSPTFRELTIAYLEDKQYELEDSTLLGMIPKIESIILPALGDIPAAILNEHRIQKYIAERAKHVKFTTIRRELEDVRAIMNWAVRKKIILENPMAGITMPKKDNERIRPPSAEEVRAIMAASPPHLKRVLIISWYTGLRVGQELFERKWHDVDFDNQIFYVVSAKKHGLDTRRVPIGEDVYPVLLQWYIEDEEAIRAENEDKGLTDEQIGAMRNERHIITWRGKPIQKIKGAWKTAKKKAGITRRLRPYDIRHAFVSDLLAQGENPATVGDIAGHKDKSTTLYVYNHVTADQHRRAINKRKSIV